MLPLDEYFQEVVEKQYLFFYRFLQLQLKLLNQHSDMLRQQHKLQVLNPQQEHQTILANHLPICFSILNRRKSKMRLTIRIIGDLGNINFWSVANASAEIIPDHILRSHFRGVNDHEQISLAADFRI